MHNIEIVVGPLGCILLIFLFGVYQSKSIVMEFQFNSFRLHESRQVDQ
ncbi:unnamed protein product [Brassica rapa]|uniref:Uncharacterized protein n=2 Tax=Brassica TaxID=3705 RepID=A0A3P6AL34_BRACM|nr:unnamed protein product [Brassica napus]CAG7891434.1 unnamed protein product [Brassica rapa]VDC84921.1 unnamed protein product [Brassica rapa]